MTEEFKPTNDIPVAEAKAEGQKLEWSPMFLNKIWSDVHIEIAELNSILKEGEKKWRLPTPEELEKAMNDQLHGVENGFDRLTSYWSEAEADNNGKVVGTWAEIVYFGEDTGIRTGEAGEPGDKYHTNYFRLVR